MGKLLRLKEEGRRETRLRLRDQTLALVEDPASSPGTTRPLCEKRMDVTGTVLRIRIKLILRFTFFYAVLDPDPACHFDADPDSTFHFDSDLEPESSLQIKAQNLE